MLNALERSRRTRLFTAAGTGSLALALLVSCAESEQTEMGTIVTSAPPQEDALVEPEPRTEAECPYLSEHEGSELNGELVTSVRIDDEVDPPACFFYTHGDEVQFTTTVYQTGSEDEARDLVDRTVPAYESDAASIEGWEGGRSGGSGGAILAVSKDSDVFVVHSRQEQSIKVERIAELALSRLD